jgi:hypothetical protein
MAATAVSEETPARRAPPPPSSDLPGVPASRARLPFLALAVVPFLLVLGYALAVHQFYHDQARWTDDRLGAIVLLLVLVTVGFGALWYWVASRAAVAFGALVPLAVLRAVTSVPGLNRHAVVTPPTQPDSRRALWARFGARFLVALGFELIVLVAIVQRGAAHPSLVVYRPLQMFFDEAIAGVLLGLLLAPAAPFLASPLRIRITDALVFPLFWLALLLLLVGGTTVLEVEILPGAVVDPTLFLTTVLLYAPAAWFVSLGFSRSEAAAQNGFLRRAWGARSGRLHFGKLQVADLPEGTVHDV